MNSTCVAVRGSRNNGVLSLSTFPFVASVIEGIHCFISMFESLFLSYYCYTGGAGKSLPFKYGHSREETRVLVAGADKAQPACQLDLYLCLDTTVILRGSVFFPIR